MRFCNCVEFFITVQRGFSTYTHYRERHSRYPQSIVLSTETALFSGVADLQFCIQVPSKGTKKGSLNHLRPPLYQPDLPTPVNCDSMKKACMETNTDLLTIIIVQLHQSPPQNEVLLSVCMELTMISHKPGLYACQNICNRHNAGYQHFYMEKSCYPQHNSSHIE